MKESNENKFNREEPTLYNTSTSYADPTKPGVFPRSFAYISHINYNVSHLNISASAVSIPRMASTSRETQVRISRIRIAEPMMTNGTCIYFALLTMWNAVEWNDACEEIEMSWMFLFIRCDPMAHWMGWKLVVMMTEQLAATTRFIR